MTNRFKHVGVLMGGPSAERDVSLHSGEAVCRGLREAGYSVQSIDPHDGRLSLPGEIEAVFIALHGTYGEDGTVQEGLREAEMPYTGSGPQSSRCAFDKVATKDILVREGIPTPAYEVISSPGDRTLPLPVMVKPLRQGSSIGMRRVFSEDEWDAAFAEAAAFDGAVLVEEFIEGKEITVGIVCDEVLPVLEIRAPNGYYDYGAKYTKGRSEYLVPAPIPSEQAEECRRIAFAVYRALACGGLARVDIRIRDDGQPFVLELNTIPGFTETSLLPKAAAAVGVDFPELCHRIMESASVK